MKDNTKDKVEVTTNNFDAQLINSKKININEKIGNLSTNGNKKQLLKNDVLKLSYKAKSEQSYKSLQIPSITGNVLKENVSSLHSKGSTINNSLSNDNITKHSL